MMIHLFSVKKIFSGSPLLSRWSEQVYMTILKCKGAYDDDVDGSVSTFIMEAGRFCRIRKEKKGKQGKGIAVGISLLYSQKAVGN